MLGGHSGVGKTSLINSIDTSLNLRVSNISDQHFQGKHTTTYAELHDLNNGLKLIDTPGIKGFGLVDFNREEIKDFFPEFVKLKSKCKFKSTWGVKFGLCLPLNSMATFDANLPKVCPSASTNTQFFSTVFLFADIVLKLDVSKIQFFFNLF